LLSPEQQLGVGHHPAEHFLDAFVFRDRLGQAGAGRCRQRAGAGGGEGAGGGVGTVEIGCEHRTVRRGVKIGQVPGRERAWCGIGHAEGGPVCWRQMFM
jgi:hypothetical protein